MSGWFRRNVTQLPESEGATDDVNDICDHLKNMETVYVKIILISFVLIFTFGTAEMLDHITFWRQQNNRVLNILSKLNNSNSN